jgi:2-dehydropantoate 2-reductase
MKVSVLGAGAVGSMFGALLKRDAPDIDVTLIVRGEHGRTVHHRQAVTIDGPWGTETVPVRASFDAADIVGSDFVFVTVKSQATQEAARAAAPYWSMATVVSIQNGMNERLLARYVDAPRLVMGMTATNMAMVAPGRVSLQLGGATVLGPAANERDRAINQDRLESVATAANVLQRIRCPELQFNSHPNAVGMRYNKLAINALGYASCVSASNFITEALCCAEWRRIVARPIIAECRRVFSAAGITLKSIPGVPSLRRLGRLTRLMDWPIVGAGICLGARRRFNRKPIVFSLRQDLAHGKPTEVEFVNGEIVRLSESVGGAAPLNSEIVRMVHELERRGAGSFFSRDEVIRRMERIVNAPAEMAANRVAATNGALVVSPANLRSPQVVDAARTQPVASHTP